MKILFLDDMSSRHDVAKARKRAGSEITHVYTAEEAIEALKGTTFDIVSLDHDLAPEHYKHLRGELPPGSAATGMVVAEFIAKLPREQRPGFAVVHSWNEWKGPKMVEVLKRAGIDAQYEPFDMN